ncbi:MAG: ATPase domain-containing protein, partial [Polyangiaceae bacterium]
MSRKPSMPRIETGIRNLDEVLGGGLPRGAVSVLAGPPGSGKTILAQQICFHNASPKHPILYFNTLSEPTAKTLRYLKQLSFFEMSKLEKDFHFVDLGVILRSKGLEQTSLLIMDRVRKVKPGIVVIDSFKTFDDLARSKEELRKFGYEVGVNLMAWEATALLLGEYGNHEYVNNPLFSVVDGLMALSQRESSGEQQRFLQVIKMRGTGHSRDEHSFSITSSGVDVFAPRVTIRREARGDENAPRCKVGIEKFDELVGEGIPRGSSLLVAGAAGTGKTVLLLEFVYRGALAGEKGIVFSFEETTERLLATARGMGWELEREIARGMIELVFVPQPDIVVEGHLLMMRERVAALGAKRVAVDSISVFLHKVKDPQISREKVFQVASIIQNSGAVGFFATDIPYGSNQISRFGVEETVVDGVILLSSTEEGFERQRYIEVYKLRNTAHLKGRHSMMVSRGGIHVFPRYAEDIIDSAPAALSSTRRLPSGIPGLDALMGGGLLERSTTLLAGSPGIGKSTFGLQFILQGATLGQPGVIFSLEERPEQLEASAEALGLPLRRWTDKGLVEIVYLSHERVRAAQFLTVLGDKIRARKARRVFLDGITHVIDESTRPSELQQLLYKLAIRFKLLDVTSLITVESKALHFGGEITERGFSPVADNLLMLRYLLEDGALCPAIRVVKTRGSVHERGTYAFGLDKGGIHILGRTQDFTPPGSDRKTS